MWVMECEGDALNSKRLFLRPGKKFVFGRTVSKGDEGVEQLFIVSDKTISRKHLTIEVGPLHLDDCVDITTRSRLTLTDLETKIGTLVNDEQIRGQSKVLDNDDNTVQLGRYKHMFRFIWVPVVLTFSFTGKEKKAKPFHTLYERLGPLDIKVLDEYVRGVTTHVVAKKRNTAKGLEALIDGKYIVHNDTFIDAITAAAHPALNGASPLEDDFDSNWPDAKQFLPPKGEEPTERRDESYAPNPERQTIFDGYSFIFYDLKQYENLKSPICLGRGIALYRSVTPNHTTINDFVGYVKSVADEKGMDGFEDGSTGKGVVVVRYNPSSGSTDSGWYAEFGRQVALKLDQRLIEQSEFLDAILGNQASVLRQALDFISSGVIAPPPTAASLLSSQPARVSQAPPVSTPFMEEMPPPPTTIRARSRRAPRTQVRSFLDDDFSGPAARTLPELVPESMEVDSTPAVVEEPESQGLFVSQNPDTQMQEEISQPPESTVRSSSKRAASPPSEEDEDILESMAPTAAANKRRRIAEQLDRKRRGESTPPPHSSPVPKIEVQKPTTTKLTTKKTRKIKETTPDLVEEVRIRREEAEALAAHEREALEAQFDGMDISEIRAKLVIETMEVKRAHPPPRLVAHADESERWEDKWNGRKNFKRFRRRGAEDTGRRVEKVIVALEEVKTKLYGIGDEFWDEPSTQQKKGKGKGKGKDTQESNSHSRPQSRAAPEPSVSVSDLEDGSLPSNQRSCIMDESSDSDLAIIPKFKAKVAPKTKASTSQATAPQKAVERRESVEPVSKKRAAPASSAKAPPAKKMKQIVTKPARREEPDEASDDDGMTFKFKKKW